MILSEEEKKNLFSLGWSVSDIEWLTKEKSKKPTKAENEIKEKRKVKKDYRPYKDSINYLE